MEDLKTIVKVENNSKLPFNIRAIFSVLDDKVQIYPFDAGIPGESHCFLKFTSPALARDALTLKLIHKDIRVNLVDDDQYLIRQYCQARENFFAPAKGEAPKGADLHSQYRRRRSDSAKHSAFSKRGSGSSSSRPNKNANDDLTRTRNSPPRKSASEVLRVATLSPLPFSNALLNSPMRKIVESSSSNNSLTGLPDSLSRVSENFLKDSHIFISSAEFSPPSATVPVNCATTISMGLLGEIITCDLTGLDSNPRVIIELLKATNSERMNYMVVAAYYRRSGKPNSAKAVLNSMLEEFTAKGLTAEYLKPVFLSLSGCEMDLVKLAKAENRAASIVAKHYTQVQFWLQKVFGKNDAPNQGPRPSKDNLQNAGEGEPGIGSSKTSKLPIDKIELDKMDHEIRSLRFRNASQASQISQLRSAKRKLEDDVSYEQNQRRKYQRQLESMQRSLDTARKMEGYALDQIKREVAARRKVEERVAEFTKLQIAVNQENSKDPEGKDKC